MRLLGLGRVSDVKPLSEEMAVDLAAEMLGEGIIFLIASGTLMFEYKRQQRKDQTKEDVQNKRLIDLEETVRDLGLTVEVQTTRVRELTRALANAGVKVPIDIEAGELPTKFIDSSSKTVLKVSSSAPAT